MKVLLSAYHCNPEDGSEPGVGWAFAAAAAQRHDVWLLSWSRYRSEVGRGVRGERDDPGGPGAVAIDVRFLGDPAPPRFERTSYVGWQRQAARTAAELHAAVGFDVTHHVTLSNTYLPVGVQLDGVPSVVGPLCGSPSPPLPLWRWLGPRGVAEEVVRVAVTAAGRAAWGRPVVRRADVVVAADEQTAARLGRGDVVIEPNAFARPDELPVPRRTPLPGGERRAVFCGRLLPWKGLRLALEALARPEAGAWRFDVYGGGKDASHLAAAVQRLGLGERVRLLGPAPRAQVLAAMADADALLMPSLHEGSSLAMVEAMAVGCPVVCLDWGGPRTLLRDGGGVLVPVGGDVAGALAAALGDLGPRGVVERVWGVDRLVDVVDGWYGRAVAGRAARIGRS